VTMHVCKVADVMPRALQPSQLLSAAVDCAESRCRAQFAWHGFAQPRALGRCCACVDTAARLYSTPCQKGIAVHVLIQQRGYIQHHDRKAEHTAARGGSACRPTALCKAIRVIGMCSVIPMKSRLSSTCKR
jgi:hypothetical protein